MNFDNLKNLNLDGDIYVDEKTLEKFSRDASIFKITPEIVISPKNVEDLQKLVNFTREQKKLGENVSLTARAAGTCMSGGSLSNSIVLDFTKYFNKTLDVSRESATAQMGIYYRDFEFETLKNGSLLPSYPASRDLCALGGIVNNNSAGEKTLKFGTTVDYVEEIEIVAADGNLYNFKEESIEEWNKICLEDKTFFGEIHRKIDKILKENKDEIEKNTPSVTKNASGYYLWKVFDTKKQTYNLAKLICGAQGTLGLVTKAKLRLVPKESYSRMIVMMVNNTANIPEIVDTVLPENPESFELFDDHTFKIAMKFWWDIAKKMGGNVFLLGLQFIPEFFMVLTGGIPKVVLIAEFTGSTQSEIDDKVEKAYENISKKFKDKKGISTRLVKKGEDKKYWTFRRESFNLLRSKLSGLRTAPFIEDVVIHKDDFPAFFPEFEKLLDQYKLIYTIAGHVGDGNLHVIPLMKLSEEKNIETIKELSEKVYELISKYKGSISGEHNDGLIRTPFLHYMFSDKMLDLFAEVKNVFDPLNIFNPGKKIGGSWEESIKKIDRKV